ncbi:leucine rich repeat domain-containing protein [Trichoderma breve]|uniref:Leucine rich repeat domain-containing protein n=1 Tax=Trichoderma breve TaxID=2034170 RepID=A0A9W9BAM0_9HYPO|nr:leucine rich repeat domain-containing protein [Trichoderma breve]KAJ4857784.1 leucine rich repeat domain-containing protein [Trichoderma breve]
MSSHAWLDSLTEDWVSERGSSPAPLSLVRSSKKGTPSPSPKLTPSRIPRWRHPGVVPRASQKKSMTILEGDRSSDENNKSPKKRLLKFVKDRKPAHKGYLERSVSSTTTGSVVVHKNARQRAPATPGKSDTPEWKRRLVQGKLDYGEQRDLFSSAAVGLQDMFKPPPSSEAGLDSPSPNFDSPSPNFDFPSPLPDFPSPLPSSPSPDRESPHLESPTTADLYETDMPSSPPAPRHPTIILESTEELNADEEGGMFSPNEITPSPSPRRPQREIKYKLNVEDDPSDLSTMSNDGPMNPSEPPTEDEEDQQDDQEAEQKAEEEKSNQEESEQEDSEQEDSEHEEPEHDGDGQGKSEQDEGSSQDDSYLAIPSLIDGGSRKASGQSYTKNEDFSPILIGKRSDEDGKVEFAPLEMPTEELREKLERLQLNQMILDPSHNASDSAVDVKPTQNKAEDDESSLKYHFDTSHGSDESAEEGSLRHHSLSPDLGEDWSEMLPEDSMQASTPKQFPTLRTQDADSNLFGSFFGTPNLPQAPFPSPDKKQIRDPGNRSNSSPLKLFGPYDTFTNQTLLRRISQFEEDMSGRNSRESSPSTPSSREPSQDASRKRYVSHFGAGELEGFEFTSELSHLAGQHSSLLSKDDKDDNEEKSPSDPPLAVKGALKLVPPQSWFPEDASLYVRRSRGKSKSQTPSVNTGAGNDYMSSSPESSLTPQDEAYDLSWVAKRDYGSETKRPRASPSKHPTPKRRRTLHRSDVAFGSEKRLRALGKQRKRSLSEYSDSADDQDEEYVSRRGSHSSGHTSRSPTEAVFQNKARRSAARSMSIQDEAEPDTTGKAAERKPSIRTQDFVDQAAQIMAMIRSQVSQPGLSSLEESELEIKVPSHNATLEESDNSTAEPFSRPPSRDGKPIPRQARQQEDPEVVKRLKKYQELSDMGDVISSSVRSMGLAKDAIRAAKEVERMVDRASRTRTNGHGGGGSNSESASETTSPVHDLFSSTSGRSTSHLFPTSSSRGSESRKVIAPESVSHLIPDKIGGMYLDKQNNIWIRNKESKDSVTSHASGSDESEEDPFANIPDLSVDMTEEMQHLKQTPRGQGVASNKDSTSRPNSAQTHSLKSYTTLAAYEPLDPEVAERARGEIEKLDAQPGDGSKAAEEAGKGLHVLKAKTSSDGLSSKRRNITISFTSPIASIILGVLPEDIEGLEDDPVPGESSESPPLLQAQFSGAKGVQGSLRAIRASSLSGSKFTPRPISRIEERDEESTVELSKGQSQSQSPHQSQDQSQSQTQTPAHPQRQRQVSYLGDNSMLSLKSLEGGSGFGFLTATPSPAAHGVSLRADDSLLIGRNVGKLSLSPLSEFTVNHEDKSFGLEVSYVMGPKRLATGDGSKKVLSMTIRDLVEKLSEAEPNEPFWDDMTSLTLQDKQLTSLHMLNEFCSKITTLDVSKNSLAHLEGVPECVRQLKVSDNMLTELTSWDHLIHLQYLDISNNEVKSLSALKRLIHLRSLRADNNLLTTLDGLDSHDGLLTLRARNNLIEELDFTGISWERLTELDVASNSISSVQGLELLPALSQLDISDNQLESLVFDKANRTLRKLDISDNHLESLDIRHLSSLQTLHADRNCLSHLSGFRYVRRLDSLSLREQQGEVPLELDFLTTACEIRKLFLSGNYLGTFELKADFLNLQLLELASCGLEELPDECGQMMPNLRILNLNFNALKDLSALRFIPRLKKLLVAGNRLSDTMAVTELLTDFPHLTELDLRDNPITQGFYPPVQMLISPDNMGSADSFMMPDADMERDKTFARRLDETTKLRRRLHEVVYVASCKRLRRLDGRAIIREKTLAKDVLLQRLIDDGLVPDLEDTLIAESESAQQQKETAPTPSLSTNRGFAGEVGGRASRSR